MTTTSKNVAIVGATGRMGQKITRELLSRGIKPRLLVRGGTKNKKAAELQEYIDRGAELVDADVTDSDTLERAFEGVDLVISVLQGGPDVIIDGQLAIAAAAKKAGVSRIIPSDFSIDSRSVAEKDHLLLGWRKVAARRIKEEIGLAQTNVFNGAFTDMLMLVFSNVIDWDKGEIYYWGDPSQPYDYTTMDDTAAYVAAAITDNTPLEQALEIVGDSVIAEEMAKIAERIEDRPFSLVKLGSFEDLDREIVSQQEKYPDDPTQWVGLQYHKAMASGIAKLRHPMNDKYPAIKPTSVETYLKQQRESNASAVN